ncbi:MAG: (2Fe-2S)-binding protein [Firmicutes bacterium]|nr:(2Fe-2S)-binding protein [Bacillota bacterium]MBR3705576.1 (2Fe-2S)-binding protein [Bacillota bacterium]
MAIDRKSREYVICPCRNVTRGEVEDIIREKKLFDIKEVIEAANVGNKCGGCRGDIYQMIDEIKAEFE